MINNPSVRRLLWKDYREYRGLWWAMLLGAVSLLYLSVGMEVWNQSSRSPAVATAYRSTIVVSQMVTVLWFGIAVCFPAAIGATSFNREHEQDTFVFLRTLPLRSYKLLFCRAIFVSVTTLSLCILFYAIGALTASLSDRFEFTMATNVGQIGAVQLLGLSVLIAAEAFAIGVFFSLLIKHPLLALLFTGVVMMGLHGSTYFTGELITVGIAVAATVGFGALDLLFVPRWFRESAPARNIIQNIAAASSIPRSRRLRMGPNVLGHVYRMVWQQLKQFGILYLLAAAVCVGLLCIDQAERGIVAVIGLPAIIACTVFHTDKSNGRYRFLSERGVHPLTVWIGRNAFGLVVVSVVCVLPLLAIDRNRNPVDSVDFRAFAVAPLLAYAVVQLCVLLTEQFIVGIFLAFVAVCFTTAWCGLTVAVSIPLVFGCLPLLVGLLVSGYKRLADLMNEKSRVINRAISWSIAFLGVVATLAATAIYRVQGIPYTDGMDQKLLEIHAAATHLTQQEKEAFDEYQNAVATISSLPTPNEGRFAFTNVELLGVHNADEVGEWVDTNDDQALDTSEAPFDDAPSRGVWTHKWSNLKSISPEERAWIEENSKPLQSIRNAISYPAFTSGYGRNGHASLGFDANERAVRLLVASARAQTEAGDLDGALVDYKMALKVTGELASHGGPLYVWISAMHLEDLVLENVVWWAGNDQQSTESIAEFKKWLTDRNANPPSPITALACDYVNAKSLIAGAPDSLDSIRGYDAGRISLTYRIMPWERIRTQRVLASVVTDQYKWLIGHPFYTIRNAAESRMQNRRNEVDSTVMAQPLLTDEHSLLRLAMVVENRRRALIWQLRLIAFRIKYGKYPFSLAEAEDRDTLRDMDVTTGRVFEYITADGGKRVVTVNEPLGSFEIVTENPTLWSSGETGQNSIRYSVKTGVRGGIRYRPGTAYTLP